jgi:integrase
VDFAKPSIRIEQALVSVGHRVVLKATKTAAGRRTVTLSRSAKAALLEVRRQQEQDRALYGEGWTDSGFVFTKPTGEPLHPDHLTRRFVRDVVSAGVPVIRLHDLRHTFATTALTAGQNPKTVSEVLGHSSVELTLAVYSHVLPGLHTNAVNAVDEMLFGEGNGD